MRTIAVMKLLSGWELSTVYQFCGIWERKPPNLIKPLSSNVNGHHISIFQGSHRLKWKEHIKEYFETQDVLPSAINSLCDNTNSFRASLVAQMAKNLPVPGSGRSPGEGNGYPFQYSCLEKSHGQRSLLGYSPWGHKELDMTEQKTHIQGKRWKTYYLNCLYYLHPD